MGIISIFDRSIYPYILILFNLIIHRLNVVYYIYYRYSHIHNYIIIYNMYCVCTHILYLICVQIRFYILNYVCTNTIIYIYYTLQTCFIPKARAEKPLWTSWPARLASSSMRSTSKPWFETHGDLGYPHLTLCIVYIYIYMYLCNNIYNTIRYQW